MEKTKEQLDVEKVWLNKTCDILISATPGSGKSTTLLELLKLATKSTLFLSFNKSIQVELQSKMTSRGLTQGKALTMHSIGFDAVRSKYNVTKVHQGKKLHFDIIKEVQKNNKKTFKYLSWEKKMKMGYMLMDLYDASRIFYTTNYPDLVKHLREQGKFIMEHKEVPDLFQQFLTIRQGHYRVPDLEIDFIDMIFLPVLFQLNIPVAPKYIFVDECQDLSTLQHTLIDQLVAQGSVERSVYVGDPYQSIYAFSGADSKSFAKLEMKKGIKKMPLTTCFRCSKNIINEVNDVYNVVTSPDWKEEGEEPKIVSDLSAIIVSDSTLVVCRNTDPLLDVFFHLISENKPCYIEGDDVLGSIKTFLTPHRYKSVPVFKVELAQQLEDLMLCDQRKEEVRINKMILQDRIAMFDRLLKYLSLSEGTVEDVLKVFERVVNGSSKKGIKLCSIHKSKGLEADYVYILNENLIPSKYALTKEQLTQEENLRYVARSRAIKQLFYLNVPL